MKRLILFIAIMISTISAFAQDSLYINKKDGNIIPYAIYAVDSISFSRRTSVYVVINGVKWATCNVNTPGTFTASPEATGCFYQWNSKIAWLATSDMTSWDSTWNGGFANLTTYAGWDSANDPSPVGYHVPYTTNFESLLDETRVTNEWTTQNGVYGRKFTDIANGNSIFLPASGLIGLNGVFGGEGSFGWYWSHLCGFNHSAFYFDVRSRDASIDEDNRASGFSIRPVAE